MKKSKLTLVAVVLSGSLLFSSCVGSFGLFNRLSSWNQGVGNKFVNELVFLAFNIVPVYGVAYLADALVTIWLKHLKMAIQLRRKAKQLLWI